MSVKREATIESLVAITSELAVSCYGRGEEVNRVHKDNRIFYGSITPGGNGSATGWASAVDPAVYYVQMRA